MQDKSQPTVLYRLVSQQRGNKLTIHLLEENLYLDITIQELIALEKFLAHFNYQDNQIIQFIAEDHAKYNCTET